MTALVGPTRDFTGRDPILSPGTARPDVAEESASGTKPPAAAIPGSMPSASPSLPDSTSPAARHHATPKIGAPQGIQPQ